MEDLNGWGPKAWDQMAKRVDALERGFNSLLGRPADAPPPIEADTKVGGIGIATWISIVAVIVVPIVLAIIATGNAS